MELTDDMSLNEAHKEFKLKNTSIESFKEFILVIMKAVVYHTN